MQGAPVLQDPGVKGESQPVSQVTDPPSPPLTRDPTSGHWDRSLGRGGEGFTHSSSWTRESESKESTFSPDYCPSRFRFQVRGGVVGPPRVGRIRPGLGSRDSYRLESDLH